MKNVKILGIKVNSIPKSQLLSLIQEKLRKKRKFYIVTPNPEIILEAKSNLKLATTLNSADFSIADGVGLKLADKNIQIIKGRELLLDLFKVANDQKLKIYLLGSKDEVMKKSLLKIKTNFPNINAQGNSGPKLNNTAEPISKVDINIQSEIVKEINNFKPNLLFVAFGAPKQELWISKWLPKLNVEGAMAVGGSLDYYSGFVRSVPNLFANLRLEWLWRLINDPKRIKRIFNATILFPFKLMIDSTKSIK